MDDPDASLTFTVVDPQSAAALDAMTAYFDELDSRFPTGFDPGDTLVADAAAMRPPTGSFVIAAIGHQVVACGGLQTIGDGIGEIKRMWVDGHRRGQRIGSRLLAELEQRSVELGHHTVRLDTNATLDEAIAMYAAAGYLPIERYNDNPFAQRWFEKPLV